MTRRTFIDSDHAELSITRQCELVGLARSSFYYKPATESQENLMYMRLIDVLYTARPYLGSRQMVQALIRHHDLHANRKRVQRLMRLMDIASVLPKPGSSKPGPEHTIYPYLLRDVPIKHVNQVWSTDITYIPVAGGWVYLVAIKDWYSRFILSWELSNSMEVSFCLTALEQALNQGQPEVFNSDQGAQFTSPKFTEVLKQWFGQF
jgi:putative transposase